MSSNQDRIVPYGEIVTKLLASTMRALSEFVNPEHFVDNKISPENVPDLVINRHFSWLALHYSEGVNRHLYDGIPPIFPLRTRALRSRNSIAPAVFDRLKIGGSVDLKMADATAYARPERTRISSLVRQAFSSCAETSAAREYQNSERKRADFITIPSPLAIVYDYLTIPEHPGSRAYPLLSLRNFLFESFRIIPDELEDHPRYQKFSVNDLESALSAIRTSMRSRFWSSGQDKLPAQGRTAVDSLLRQFLSMNRIFNLRFESPIDCFDYLQSGTLLNGGNFEFERNPFLEKLPELGELVNEIWGLPLPIRGADTIFRGGLKFSARRGLVCALHGGAGSGKTSLSLGIGAALAGFGIKTIFFTAEETAEDLFRRTNGLLADDIRRLSFVPKLPSDWLQIVRFKMPAGKEANLLDDLKARFREIAEAIREQASVPADAVSSGPPLPCQTVVVLDGLHDLATRAMRTRKGGDENDGSAYELHEFIEVCRELQAFVILTTGTDWAADTSLDYLVDVALRLTHETESESGSKPDRFLTLSKARHQLCSPGSHGLQIAGQKGVRFTPQMNYQLDRRSIWSTRLPDQTVHKKVMRLATDQRMLHLFPTEPEKSAGGAGEFHELATEVRIFKGSNTFINGEGSGGKAALALKIAVAPSFGGPQGNTIQRKNERVLIVSFLYPQEYYQNILRRLLRIMLKEYGTGMSLDDPRIDVIHLYPGHLKPGVLFNRIEWQLLAADLEGDPFSSVIVDGIHNVFLQFPEIEKQGLFWPQLFSMLRTRDVSIVSTHALLTVGARLSEESNLRIDDRRSDPLRHALVQKTDFRFDVEPRRRPMGATNAKIVEEHFFVVRTLSAIGQQLPPPDELFWSRERLVLFSASQKSLPFPN